MWRVREGGRGELGEVGEFGGVCVEIVGEAGIWRMREAIKMVAG